MLHLDPQRAALADVGAHSAADAGGTSDVEGAMALVRTSMPIPQSVEQFARVMHIPAVRGPTPTWLRSTLSKPPSSALTERGERPER
jgi:hypothetical protein